MSYEPTNWNKGDKVTSTRLNKIEQGIQGNNNELGELRENLIAKFPVIPLDTAFFDGLNYGIPQNVTFYNDRFADTNGKVTQSANTSSIVFDVEPNTTYYIYIPNKNRSIAIESSDDFTIGSTYTRLTSSDYSRYNNTVIHKITTGATAKKVFYYFYNGSYDYVTYKNAIIITKNEFVETISPKVKENALPPIPVITPKDTTFFDNINCFNPERAEIHTDRIVSSNGTIVMASNNAAPNTLVFPVEPNTTYYLYIPSMDRGYVVENSSKEFKVDSTYTLIHTGANTEAYSFTTGSTAKYVAAYFCSTSYNYDANKNSIVLNKNVYVGNNADPYIPSKYLPADLRSKLQDAKILIFGDSITTTCNITIDAENQTSAYSWRNPSNSYVNAGGTTVQFSMWPKILKLSEPCGEIRNYAESGASYKTATRESGYERQNLQYQIDVAMNDLDNPNDVFNVDDYVPDIVIFALGTNDGAPNDTYDSAMAKLVFESDGKTINVTSTITALDDTKFFESAMKAYLRIKQAFPMAQIFCVLPIQRADSSSDGTLHDGLKKIAQRYGCIIIDGAFDSGITREFNVWDGLGTYLKDGLHPNEKGQNLMARMIISALKAHYMPFGTGFN